MDSQEYSEAEVLNNPHSCGAESDERKSLHESSPRGSAVDRLRMLRCVGRVHWTVRVTPFEGMLLTLICTATLPGCTFDGTCAFT